MQRQSPRTTCVRTVTLCVVTLLLASAAVGPVSGTPALFVDSGTVDGEAVLVGEDVEATVLVKNVGTSGGGKTVQIKRNGTTVASQRVVVEANGQTRMNETLRFDEPGRYVISAADTELGTVRVRRAVASVTDERPESRTVALRASAGSTSGPYTVDFPAASTRSFAVERWTVESDEPRFRQSVTEYAEPAASGVELPESGSVVGVLTVESNGTVDAATMRTRVQRTTLESAGLGAGEVGVYHLNESTGSWEPIETSVATQREDSVVYEATATEFSTFAVGSVQPAFSVEGTELDTTADGDGQRVVLRGTVSNSGAIRGEYTAEMVVDGERVDEETVTVPAGGQRTVELSHTVTESGTYDVALGDRTAGSVVLSDRDVSPGTATDTDRPTPATAVGEELPPEVLLETVMGVSTRYLVAGTGVALVLFVVLGGLLWRRGGGGGGGGLEQL